MQPFETFANHRRVVLRAAMDPAVPADAQPTTDDGPHDNASALPSEGARHHDRRSRARSHLGEAWHAAGGCVSPSDRRTPPTLARLGAHHRRTIAASPRHPRAYFVMRHARNTSATPHACAMQ